MGKRKEKITLKAHSEHSKIETKHNQKKEPCCKILTLFYFKVSPSCIIEFMAEYEKLLKRSKAGSAPFGRVMGISQSLHHFIKHSTLKCFSSDTYFFRASCIKEGPRITCQLTHRKKERPARALRGVECQMGKELLFLPGNHWIPLKYSHFLEGKKDQHWLLERKKIYSQERNLKLLP